MLVATKATEVLSRQKRYLWQLPPMIVLSPETEVIKRALLSELPPGSKRSWSKTLRTEVVKRAGSWLKGWRMGGGGGAVKKEPWQDKTCAQSDGHIDKLLTDSGRSSKGQNC